MTLLENHISPNL